MKPKSLDKKSRLIRKWVRRSKRKIKAQYAVFDNAIKMRLWLMNVPNADAYLRVLTTAYKSDSAIARQEKLVVQFASYDPYVVRSLYMIHGRHESYAKLSSKTNAMILKAKDYDPGKWKGPEWFFKQERGYL